MGRSPLFLVLIVATQEGLGVILIPLNSVKGQVVVLVSLSVLIGEGFIANMNVTFLGTNDEKFVVLCVKVEAHTAGGDRSVRPLSWNQAFALA